MPNFLIDNTYHILDTSATALAWPTNPRIQSVVFFATNTNAAAAFLIAAGTPILRFALVVQSSMGGSVAVPATYSVIFSGAQFPTAWIPSTMTACSAWINFA